MTESFQCANLSERCYCVKHKKCFYGTPSECCEVARYTTQQEEDCFVEGRRQGAIDAHKVLRHLMKHKEDKDIVNKELKKLVGGKTQ